MNLPQNKDKGSSGSSQQLMNDKFGRSIADKLEEEFKKTTVGLVSKDEYKRRLKSIYTEAEQTLLMQDKKKNEKKKEPKEANQTKKKAVLSFEDELNDEDDNNDPNTLEPKVQKKKNIGKDPNVDTSFLPDKTREHIKNEMRQKLSEEFVKEQEKIKEQILEVKYALWNGLNDVKTQRVRKNTTVGSFVDLIKKDLDKEYPEIRQLTIEGLMFVLDDCIIPFGYTFYELLASKVKSERGLLIADKKKEGEENVYEQTSIDSKKTKAVKIVDKRVYEKGKHIFPCNTWKIVTDSFEY